jgi:hypothetical protein
MTPKLSPELALEMDRNGNRPLSVEDPRTHKLYVIVAEEEFASKPRSPSNGTSQQAWTPEKNARRFALIDKQFDGTLTATEAEELEGLQQEVDEYLDREAPLPLEAVRALHGRLLRQSTEGSKG